uniref:Uncharacterized protein n=1 Tax=Romanomermis culicivorax TaxID=13658 RepID=A0A915JVU5_ROMCU
MEDECLTSLANLMRRRNQHFSALGADQVTSASLLIFPPKLRKFNSKGQDLTRRKEGKCEETVIIFLIAGLESPNSEFAQLVIAHMETTQLSTNRGRKKRYDISVSSYNTLLVFKIGFTHVSFAIFVFFALDSCGGFVMSPKDLTDV